MSLDKGIADYALISAFRDSRFRKIEQHELEDLQCGCVVIILYFQGGVFLNLLLQDIASHRL